eukprot:gene7785-9134_t
MGSMSDLGIKVVQLDVTDPKSISNAITHIIDREGHIDILINNAGMVLYGPVVEIPMDDLRQLFETNFFGLVNVTNEVAKHMAERRNGIIMNVGSVVALMTTPFTGSYCASKAAVHAWTDALRMELDPFNIKVITAIPGCLASDIIEKATPRLDALLRDNSMYAPIASDIQSRPQLAKRIQAPLSTFSELVISVIFRHRLPASFRHGPGTLFLLLFRLLPTFISDYILRRRFGHYHPWY